MCILGEIHPIWEQNKLCTFEKSIRFGNEAKCLFGKSIRFGNEVRTITYLTAWTVKFEHCIEVQLTTHQPPIPNFSNFSLVLHVYRILSRYNGMFPYWIHSNFWKVEEPTNSFSKSGLCRTSGSTFGSRNTRSRFRLFVLCIVVRGVFAKHVCCCMSI